MNTQIKTNPLSFLKANDGVASGGKQGGEIFASSVRFQAGNRL
jgi:hypothetical protein